MFMMQFFFFYIFSFFAVLSAYLVVVSINPVYSVFFLVLAFCNVSGILLLLEVEFIAMLFLLVYVGAIAVLFLFVVMMLVPRVGDSSSVSFLKKASIGPLIGALAGLVFMFERFVVGIGGFERLDAEFFLGSMCEEASYTVWLGFFDGVGLGTSNIEVLGQLVYSYYFCWFLLGGFVLLVAMLGAITLTLQGGGSYRLPQGRVLRRQRVYEQLSRRSVEAIFKVKA